MAEETKATTEEFQLILKMISKGYKVPKIIYDTIFDVAKREIEEKNRVVLYKRDPNIHSRRIQGAYVKVIGGDCIEIHPAVVGGFGADFDGDAMAIFTLISEESQKEIKEKMISIKHSEKLNESNFKLSMEMLTGIFTLTSTVKPGSAYKKVKTIEELKSLHIGQKVEFRLKGNQKTTAGRVIFNLTLPEWMPFIDEDIPKGVLNKLLEQVMSKGNDKEYANLIDGLMRLGFFYSTIYPKTISLDLTKINDKLQKLKNDLNQTDTVAKQADIVSQMEVELLKFLKSENSDLYYWVKSGGSKGTNQIRQILVAKGVIQDPSGNVLPPISKSMNDGYTPEEYFTASAAARKGTIDRSLNTGFGGYAYRKMIYVTGDVTADINNVDCGTRETLNVKLTKELLKRFSGRYAIEDRKIVPITDKLLNKMTHIRSPIFCKTKQICRTCYGNLLYQLNSKHVGMFAAQECASLSEKIMKTFHLGGAVILEKIDIIASLMENLDDSYEPVLRKAFTQKDVNLINNQVSTLIKLDKSIYEGDYKIKETPTEFILPVGHFIISIDQLEIRTSFEKEVVIYKTDEMDINDNLVIITYGKNQKLIRVEPQKEDFTKLAQNLDKFVAGKSPWTDVPSLYLKFYKNLGIVGDWDSVHLEVIISNILRAKRDPQKPARLVTPFDPVTFSIKKLPRVISYPLGIALEDFSKSVQYGMISEKAPPSPIEKVLNGQSLTEED